jgi:hypothetical protein
MAAFRPPLKSLFSEQELDDVYMMMEERDIRISQPLQGELGEFVNG